MRRNHPWGKRGSTIPAFTVALMAAGVLTNVHAQIQTAGTLFVDVDATTLPAGPVTSIENRGTLGGVFAATGGEAATPIGGTIGGTKGILFDGSDYLQHMTAAVDGSPLTSPAEITGLDPTHSIEVWAWNPDIADEETLVSWGRRGDPGGSNVSFNYGRHPAFGAVGHWGNSDIGWNNAGGAPVAGKWHHLVYTYDGTTTRVYSDGVMMNAEYVGAGAISTVPDTTILLGAQTEGNAVDVTAGLRLNGALGRVRIHDEVLTAAQIANNYNLEKASFIDPVNPEPPVLTPAKLAQNPIHRWSFNEPVGDAMDKTFEDSIGDADGVVRGSGATFTGTRLVLPGGPSVSAAYGDLPNHLLSNQSTNNGGTGKFSIETWVKVTGAQNWGRIFDIGNTGPGGGEGSEITGPGGSGEGRDYFTYTATRDTTPTVRRLEIRNESPAGGGIVTVDNPTTIGVDTHLLVTWDEATGQVIAYENGRQVSTVTTDDAFSDIDDVNVWLGRSNWTADANMQGEFDEVRIYNHVLSPAEALGSSQAGPFELNTRDVPTYFATNPTSTTLGEGSPATFTAQTYGSYPVTLQWYRDGVLIPNATNTTYTIPRTSVADNNAVFTVRATSTINGSPVTVTSTAGTLTVVPPTERLSERPIHRWSFSEAEGDATDAEFRDSIGTAHGVVLGSGATFSGSRLVLPGGSSASAPYGDLPNGLLSSHGVANGGTGKFTIETWFKVTGTQGWARVFDFGSTLIEPGVSMETGELFGPGGGGEGRDYLMYSANNGTDLNNRQMSLRNQDPAGGGDVFFVHPTSPNVDIHLVLTWDEATGRVIGYENGVQVGSVTTPDKMSDINDVNVWLGRSNWTQDANLQGEIDEVRIYDTVLTGREVLGNYIVGPNDFNDHDIAPSIISSSADSTVPEGASITLSVRATGSTPLAYQWFRNNVAIQGEVSPTLQLSNVNAQDQGGVYTVRVSNTVNGQTTTVTSNPINLTVQPYTVTLKHRYSFNETEGTVITDLVGDADGELLGSAVLDGGKLILDGTFDTYANLPNGIISGLGFDGTIELWIDSNTPTIWSRIFDFGISNGGEDVNDGGSDFLFLVSRNGDGMPQFTANFPTTGDINLIPQPPGWIIPGEPKHVVISYMASKNISAMYMDGVLVRTGTAPRPLSDLAGRDVNNWLGKSQWPDPFWAGSYDELRLSSGAMTAAQVAASFAAGPNSLPSNEQPPRLSIARDGSNVVISWPASATGYILESTTSLTPPVTWTQVTGATQNGANMQVSVPTTGSARFFRLRK